MAFVYIKTQRIPRLELSAAALPYNVKTDLDYAAVKLTLFNGPTRTP